MTDEGIRIETSPAPPGGAGPSHADGGEAQPDVLAILPLRETVLFPQAVIPLAVARPSSVRAVDEAVLGGRLIGLLTQRDASQESPAPPDMHRTGTIATIHRMLKQPDGTIRLVVQGIERFRVVEFTQTAPYLRARIERVPDVMPAADDVEAQALGRQASALFQKVVELSPTLSDDLLVLVSSAGDAGRTIDLIAATLPSLTTAERQTLLETPDVKVRLKALVTSLTKEAEVLELGSKIHSQVQSEMTKTQREYYLREQLKAIQKELGEGDDRGQELTELREKIDAVGMSEEAHREALRELGRLEKMPPAAAEYSVARTYLEWLTALPWRKETTDDLDLVRARAVLDEDHWGLGKIKDRLLEHLAVRKIRPEGKAPILCFVGPPGVGKTSLGRSIARALGRKFHRIALGGMRDEAEIRGHRRTYIGALPGQIVQGLRRTRVEEPRVHARRDRQARVRLPGRPGVGLAGGAGPGAERDLPGPLPRRAVRPFAGPVHHDGEPAGPGPGAAARPDGDHRAAGVHRGREGRDRPAPPHSEAGDGARSGPRTRTSPSRSRRSGSSCGATRARPASAASSGRSRLSAGRPPGGGPRAT